MKDERIIKDLFNRSEEALKVLKEKYEKPCMNIAMKLVSRYRQTSPILYVRMFSELQKILPWKNITPIQQRKETVIMI